MSCLLLSRIAPEVNTCQLTLGMMGRLQSGLLFCILQSLSMVS